MIVDIISGICFIAFLLFMLGICWAVITYVDSSNKYCDYSCKPKDSFYWTSTITYPRENDKE